MPTGPSATSRKLVPHFCRVPAEKVDGKIVTWSGSLCWNEKTAELQYSCGSLVEVWTSLVCKSMWMNVNHEVHMICHLIQISRYHITRCHKMLDMTQEYCSKSDMLISIFETKVSSRNRDTLCGPCCEGKPCPANYQNHVLL